MEIIVLHTSLNQNSKPVFKKRLGNHLEKHEDNLTFHTVFSSYWRGFRLWIIIRRKGKRIFCLDRVTIAWSKRTHNKKHDIYFWQLTFQIRFIIKVYIYIYIKGSLYLNLKRKISFIWSIIIRNREHRWKFAKMKSVKS